MGLIKLFEMSRASSDPSYSSLFSLLSICVLHQLCVTMMGFGCQDMDGVALHGKKEGVGWVGCFLYTLSPWVCGGISRSLNV